MTDPFQIQDTREGCLLCLHYFGIFKYPLTDEQMHLFTPYRSSPDGIKQTMDRLIREQQAFKIDGYYLKNGDPEWIAERRLGESRALKLLERSSRYVSIIASFPFVRGIAISGSLSKFYAAEQPDIDYFIITDHNRLWIARSLLHLFKKLTFVTGHEHYFCMNYFIDNEVLKIEHSNLYSAIEVKTLLPVYNKELLKQFCHANTWTDEYLPNHHGANNFNYLIKDRKRPVKALWEMMINLFFPKHFNRYLMAITDRKWRRKWKRSGFDMNEYDMAFRTAIHVSKNHPTDYQKKVMESLPDSLKKAKKK
jgi:hypothetical protein